MWWRVLTRWLIRSAIREGATSAGKVTLRAAGLTRKATDALFRPLEDAEDLFDDLSSPILGPGAEDELEDLDELDD